MFDSQSQAPVNDPEEEGAWEEAVRPFTKPHIKHNDTPSSTYLIATWRGHRGFVLAVNTLWTYCEHTVNILWT